MNVVLLAVLLAFVGCVLFSLIGLVSGTDETAVMVPFTLLVILLGAPPAAVFAFFMAAVLAKHITHAVPTALMGIPGDTMAVPLIDHATILRRLGVPHIALRKMISAGILAAFLAFPISLIFAHFLSQFADFFKEASGPIFTIAAFVIAYFSKGKWASVIMVLPFAFFISATGMMSFEVLHKHLAIAFFLGIAVGPMIADLLASFSSNAKTNLLRSGKKEYVVAPDVKSWSGYFPNPLRALTGQQKLLTLITAFISSLTFTLSPVGMTSLLGESVGSRVPGLYKKSTTSLAVMNGVTEATYVAETIIPLVAFGLPLSPMALGPAAPLFSAPPVFTTIPIHNLHNLITPWGFFVYGLIGLVISALIAYPFTMNYARTATIFIMRNVSQEAIIAMFVGLVAVLAFYEGHITGVLLTLAVATFGGLLNRILGVGAGVQFMIFYGSTWMMAHLL